MNVKINRINNTNLIYLDYYESYLDEYYQYIVNCFTKALSMVSDKPNILIGNFNKSALNDIKIDANIEHTLVKQGGRDSNGHPIGKIPYGDNQFYLCRIVNIDYLYSLDFVIDYSMPNIKNIETSGHFNLLYNKFIYVAPIIFDIDDFIYSEREINFISMFIDENQVRRRLFLDKIKEENINLSNIQNCYTKDDLKNLYSKVKVLVNIHQTDHHDTFEELRVLGALLNGVIIISEDVPLKEEIPYSSYIVWTSYDNVCNVMRDVEENYLSYWDRIFGDGKLKQILIEMEDKNIYNIKNKLLC
jgi:hypothetical protein